jgi:cytochrome b6-f complex iron-sulfur subunit
MDRREFMTWMGIGGLATSLPVVLAACQSQEPAATNDTSADAPTADTGSAGSSEVIGTVADLETNGFLLKADAAVGPVLVVGTADALSAVNPTCTHAGCTVEWKGDQTLMVCPCHGSQFNSDGTVAKGPATEPLPTYAVQVEGDNVVVS